MGYAGSPKLHSTIPLEPKEFLCSVCKSPDMAKIAQYWPLPSAGPNKLAIIPLGDVTDWYFKTCNLLYPLYHIHWFTFGLQKNGTVLSIKP